MPTDHSTVVGADLHEDKRTKVPVRVASTANLNIASPGTSIDGVTMTTGDRVLLKNQTTASQNGIYDYGTSATSMTRSVDLDQSSDFLVGFMVYVAEGTTNAHTVWAYSQIGAVTMGSTSITFAAVGSGGSGGGGFTNPMTAIGDIIVGIAGGVAGRLGIGGTNQVLTVSGGTPVWATPASGGFTNPMSTLGDMIIGLASGVAARLAAGTTGQVLSIVSGSPAWSRAIDVMTGIGDLLTGGTAGAPSRLAPGTAGTFLQSNGPGAALTWAAPASSGGSSGGGGGGSIVPIQTQTPSGTNTVTFAVPTGFRSLRFSGVVASDTAAPNTNLQLRFNGDASAIYDWNTAAANLANDTSITLGRVSAATAPAGSDAPFWVEIPNYLGTTFHKSLVGRVGVKLGTTGTQLGNDFSAGWWRSTAGVSSVTLLLQAGSFVNGSTITLWGESDTSPTLLAANSNLIQETILTTAQSFISIANIPQGYRDLRITGLIRSQAVLTSDNLSVRLNADPGANYDYQPYQGIGVITGVAAGTSILIGRANAANAPASKLSPIEIYIPDYTNSGVNKPVMARIGVKVGTTTGSFGEDWVSGFWRSNAGVTGVILVLNTGPFEVGSVVRVYGEPAAAGGTSVGTGVRMRISTNQSISTATPTVLNWDVEDTDADLQHFTSSAALTGTVAKTTGSNQLAGTSTLFTTELSVGQVISVPGGSTETAVVIAIASNTSLTVAQPFANTATVQVATRVNSALVFRQPGFYTVSLGVFWASATSGNQSVSIRLNGTTPLNEDDKPAITAALGQSITVQRPFQQWDYVEAVVSQTTTGALNVLADERTSFASSSRPTVIVGSNTNSQLYQQTKIRGTGNKQTTSASFVVIDNTNMPPLSLTLAQGDVVRLTLMGMALTATGVICFDFQVVQPTLGTTRVNQAAARGITSVTQAVNQPLNAVTSFVAAESGVHTFQPVWVQIGGGTGTLYNDSVTNDTEIFVSAEKIGVQGASSGGTVPSFSSGNRFLAGPVGGPGPVGLRIISPFDLPIMVGSGPTHAVGVVPDPGATAGLTKFLREDGSWQTPPGTGGGGGGGGGLVAIQTQSPSGTGTATFTVPAGYRNLRMTINGRSDAASNNTRLNLQFNGDATAANYFNQNLYGINASPGFGTGLATNALGTGAYIGTIAAATSPTSVSSAIACTIHDYLNTAFHKQVEGISSYLGATAANVTQETTGGRWANTAAITSIAVVLVTGNWVAGSTITLWGESEAVSSSAGSGGVLVPIQVIGPILASQATMDFPAIPQTYRNLRLVWDIRGDTAATDTTLRFRANGDSSAIYDNAGMAANSGGGVSGATHAEAVTSAIISQFPAASAPSPDSGSGFAVIPNYTSTTFRKHVVSQGSDSQSDGAGGKFLIAEAATWRSSAAITSISLFPAAGNFVAGSYACLYGESDTVTAGAAVPYATIQEQQPSGTTSQGTFTSGAFRTRTLNTITSDLSGIVSLASNQLTLQAGTYSFSWSAPAQNANAHQTRLQDITNSVTLILGSVEYNAVTNVVTRSMGSGKVRLLATTVIELQHRFGGSGNQGGPPASYGTEVYSILELRKEA